MARKAKQIKKKVPASYKPSGFESQEDFLRDMRVQFALDLEFDNDNREAALEDSTFVAGEQWDEVMRAEREMDNKPCITVNRLPAFVGQVVGNRRLNETTIKVTPDIGGTKAVAKVRQGLIRSVEKTSKADRAYNNAFQSAVICGIGNFGLVPKYARDDVFEQDISIYPINNPLGVVWDRYHRDPTGRDAQRAFEVDNISNDSFKATYGDDAQAGDLGFDEGFDPQPIGYSWEQSDRVRIVRYWRMIYETRVLALMVDGDVRDITDETTDDWMLEVDVDDDGDPYVRESERSYAELHVCTANQILEGPVRYPIKRIPIFKVPGWEIDTAFNRARFGLIRFAKDPQRMHNYWRSVIVEKLMLTPYAPWIAADTAVAGREDEWRSAHVSSDTLLVYNADSGAPPKRAEPAQMEPALIQEAGMAMQDIRDVTNLHEANFGQTSNEVSGRAIVARQRVGEIGTVIYTDNLNMAIEEAGEVINDLIPVIYDTKRMVKIIEMESGIERETIMTINDTADENSVDVTVGKYSVTVTTGPSFVTRRLEAQEGMLNMVNANPQAMQLMFDQIIEAQDWPGAEKMAQRYRKTLPPGLVEEDPEDLTDEQKKQRVLAAQAAEKKAQFDDAMAQIALQKAEAEVAELRARAIEAEARAKKAMEEVGLKYEGLLIDKQKADNDTLRVQIEAAEADARIGSMDITDKLGVMNFLRPTGQPQRGAQR